MTEDDLIALALGMPEASQNSHFETRDFRVRGRIFLTLPGGDYCVLQLRPDQQKMVLATLPAVAMVVPGGWGERGATRLYYAMAEDDAVAALVEQCWRNAAPKSLQDQGAGTRPR